MQRVGSSQEGRAKPTDNAGLGARGGSAVVEYLLIVILFTLIFVTILAPKPDSKMGASGAVYDLVRLAFRREMVVIGVPLL